MTLSLAGWLLPANQLALADFEKPADQTQNFEVISVAQAWGDKQRYWIALSDAGDRLGYLVVDQDLELALGAGYRGPIRLRAVKTLDRADFSAQLIGDYQLISQPNSWQQFTSELRSAFQRRASGLSADSKGLVLGLTIGDRSQISNNLIFAMRELSLSHIIAVSGANLAIAMGAAFAIARLVGAKRRLRYLAASLTAFAYAAIVGPEPSVLRALFMAHVLLLCLFIGRRTAALIAISWTVLVLLAVDPFLATDFGFALSVAATTGILMLTEPIQRRFETRMPRVLALALAVSIAAQLFTLPILLLLQSGIPSYSVIANLLAMPMLAPITLLGLLAFSLQAVPQATELLTSFASVPAWLVELLANFMVQLPLTRFPWPEEPVGVVLAGGIAILCAVGLRNISATAKCVRLVMALALLGVVVGVAENQRLAFPSNWEVIACDVGQGDALLFRSAGAVALIDVGPEPKLVADCLHRAGVDSIDLLVLTHFDIDHVGGIQGVIDCCQLSAVMLPDFDDGRENALDVSRALEEISDLQIVTAANGLTGMLGEANWRVLSPGPIEQSGSDSNAASITLFVEATNYRLLALADVPASVQDRIAHQHSARLARQVSVPTILKVSHHGAADQSAYLIRQLDPQFAIFSAGQGNRYGHPTEAALKLVAEVGAGVIRTDLLGGVALYLSSGVLRFD